MRLFYLSALSLTYDKPERPAKDQAADRVSYQLHASLVAPSMLHQEQCQREALFVLACNEFDLEKLPDQQILSTYKSSEYL